MGDITLQEINELEKVFLEIVGFDLYIKGGEYAKYYFILKALQKEIVEPEFHKC